MSQIEDKVRDKVSKFIDTDIAKILSQDETIYNQFFPRTELNKSKILLITDLTPERFPRLVLAEDVFVQYPKLDKQIRDQLSKFQVELNQFVLDNS